MKLIPQILVEVRICWPRLEISKKKNVLVNVLRYKKKIIGIGGGVNVDTCRKISNWHRDLE